MQAEYYNLNDMDDTYHRPNSFRPLPRKKNNNLIVSVSIEIPFAPKLPLSYRSQQLSTPCSPNKLKKKHKIAPTPMPDKRTSYSSHVNTLRDIPSRKKHTAVVSHPHTPRPTQPGRISDLSPKKRPLTSRKTQGGHVVRNISILEQVASQQDSIIRYTSNSGQILKNPTIQKLMTTVSEVDLEQMRMLSGRGRQGKEQQLTVRATQILRTACAKKIQRAWRNYKTRKLIRSYSNDIRRKDIKGLTQTKSSSVGLRFKRKLIQEPVVYESEPIQKQEEQGVNSSSSVLRFQQESMQRWQQMIEQIKNKRNIEAALQISEQKRHQLQEELYTINPNKRLGLLNIETPRSVQKDSQRGTPQGKQPRKGQTTSEVARRERVAYFQNQMLKIQNDLSDISVRSSSSEEARQMQQLQNIKLRKKLELFKNHLPQMQIYSSNTQTNTNTSRIDIVSIMDQKRQAQRNKPAKFFAETQGKNSDQQAKLISKQGLTIQNVEKQLQNLPKTADSTQDVAKMKKTRLKKANQVLEEMIDQQELVVLPVGPWLKSQKDDKWLQKLKNCLEYSEDMLMCLLLEQLVLQNLIQVADSQKLITCVKDIYERTKAKAKFQGIVTNQSSIRDYLNYFISYLQEQGLTVGIQQQLNKPIGPSALDVLKYFRGQQVAYDPDNEYIMNIQVFNRHWEYANTLIYFDQKYDDPNKQQERVNYLKKLTKMFYRAIFDCLNQSLELQRVYGLRGKPYPWGTQKVKSAQVDLSASIFRSFQRVIRYSMIFCGVLFADKQHNIDPGTIAQIQQQNLMKLVLFQFKDDEVLWLFYQDELVDVRLQICQHIQQQLLRQIAQQLF